MRPWRWWLLAAIALGAGVALWLGVGSDAGGPATSPAGTRQAAQEADPGHRRTEAPPVAAADDAPGPQGESFVFIVSAADGSPVPGAHAVVSSTERRPGFHRGPPPEATARADAAGRVTFPPFTRGGLVLTVSQAFFRRWSGPLVPGATVALEPITPVRGRVLLASREPAAGALVSTQGADPVATRTDGAGRFELRLPWYADLVAEKDGLLATSPTRSLIDDQPLPELELVLAPQRAPGGTVRRRDGSPLSGVEVVVSLGQISLRQITGPDGRYAWTVPGRLSAGLRFSLSGFVPVELEQQDRPPSEVVLSRPGRITGRVRSVEGLPLPGVTVTVADSAEDEALESRPQTSVTDPRGNFVFENVTARSLNVLASTEDRWTEKTFALEEGASPFVELVLPPPLVTVEVEVVTVSGASVDDYEVLATPVPDQGWTSRCRRFDQLGLTRGLFRFEVRLEGGEPVISTQRVDPTADGPPLRFVVPDLAADEDEPDEPATVLNVRVVDPLGTPVEGAQIDCYSGAAVSAADGRAACSVRGGPNAWPIHVIAQKDGATGTLRTDGTQAEVRVVLHRSRSLRGRILGPLPAQDIVELVVNAASVMRDLPLAGNAFTIEQLPVGRTFVCVVARSRSSLEPDRRLGCAVSDDDAELVIVVGAPGTVTFRALDAQGTPLEAPIVYVDREQQSAQAPGGVVGLAVAPGSHVLVLNEEGTRARHEVRFTVEPGRVTALGDLTLR